MKILQDHVLQTVDELEPQTLQWLQDLVRIPSLTGEEVTAQRYMAKCWAELGLEVDLWYPQHFDLQDHPAFSDDGLPLGERPVVVARWSGDGSGARSLILNGHIDVVPPGEQARWTGGPWSGALRDGSVWGRGSCDMKGGLVAGMTAISALLRSGVQLRSDVVLESVIGEETGGVGTLAAVLRGYRADAAIVLEPTRMAICPTGAGAASFRLRVPGLAAHGAMRLKGVSAVEKFYVLFAALQELEQLRHAEFRHPLFEAGMLIAPISIGKISAGDWPSTVPESLVAEGRYGILPGESINAARRQFESSIRTAAESDLWLKQHAPAVEWFEGQFEPAQTQPDAPILGVLKDAHSAVVGTAPSVHGVPYGSDLRFFTNNAGMDAVLYGPGDVALAHSVDEHVPVREVMQAAKVIAVTILRWCQ